ncbi:MAG: hypothetical protein ABH884_03960 [Candidatus Komeilibacteria bacterium]
MAQKAEIPITIIKGGGQDGHTLLFPGDNGCIGEITGKLKRVILSGGQDLDKYLMAKDRVIPTDERGGNEQSMVRGVRISYMQWLIYRFLKLRAEHVVETVPSNADIFFTRAKSKGQESVDWVKIGKIADFKPALLESIKETLGRDFQQLGRNWLFTNLYNLKKKGLIDQIGDGNNTYLIDIEPTVVEPEQMFISRHINAGRINGSVVEDDHQKQRVQLSKIGVIAQAKLGQLQTAIAPAKVFLDLINSALNYRIAEKNPFKQRVLAVQELLASICSQDDFRAMVDELKVQQEVLAQMRNVFVEIIQEADKILADQLTEK